MQPLGIDLFCGLGGWTEGLLAEGYYVIGFDIERHEYWMPPRRSMIEGDKGGDWFSKKHSGNSGPANNPKLFFDDGPLELIKYPAQLVLQDVLTLHGSQFKDAALIVASPPCQAYSYRAMPWKRAKALPPPDNSLFEACFRIQREACAAAGKYIPMVVENVRGANKWVGRSRWNYGSFHLWGDVPALMPMTKGIKNNGGSWFNIGSPGQKVLNQNPLHDGIKQHKSGRAWFADPDSISGSTNSRSKARKAASAMIAKIPLPLARYIARTYLPTNPADNANIELQLLAAEVE